MKFHKKPNEIWSEYKRAVSYNRGIDLYETVRKNENFFIGKQWEGLRRMETESGRMVHALRGVSCLLGETVKLNPVPVPKELPRRALEKSFHRTRRLRDEMEKRCGDPEYGIVFRSLARKAEDLCAAIAEMLGKLEA